MIDALLHFIEANLLPWGALGVFLAAILEEVVAPIPSQVVILSASFTFVKGTFSVALLWNMLWYVVIPISLGITFGSLVVYYLSYYLGKPFIEKWGSWIGLSWADIEKIEVRYSKGKIDELLVFVLRAIPIIPSVAIAAFSGVTRIPVKTYIIFSILGSMIRVFVLGVIGWQVGNLYIKYANIIGRYEDFVLYGIILCVILFVIYRIINKKKTL